MSSLEPVLTVTFLVYIYVLSTQFGIVFTAEPNSTNMFTYKWDGRGVNGTGVLTNIGNVSCTNKCEFVCECVCVYVCECE